MAEDDAIMKTRLLIDGDGMGDDRKINTLIRQIVKFAGANADETPEDVRHVVMLMPLTLTHAFMFRELVTPGAKFNPSNREILPRPLKETTF